MHDLNYIVLNIRGFAEQFFFFFFLTDYIGGLVTIHMLRMLEFLLKRNAKLDVSLIQTRTSS